MLFTVETQNSPVLPVTISPVALVVEAAQVPLLTNMVLPVVTELRNPPSAVSMICVLQAPATHLVVAAARLAPFSTAVMAAVAAVESTVEASLPLHDER